MLIYIYIYICKIYKNIYYFHLLKYLDIFAYNATFTFGPQPLNQVWFLALCIKKNLGTCRYSAQFSLWWFNSVQ